jgi:orotidine-5'-phosphate decarboxylase
MDKTNNMKLCIALDLPTMNQNLSLIDSLQDFDNIWYKVGFRSYIRDGKTFLDNIKSINQNNKIFLDLKLYDIPNTMADASQEIANMGVDMFNVHASAGSEAMSGVMDRLSSFNNRPLVLAVTALTSFDDNIFKPIYHDDIATKADFFAKQAYKSGLDGVVSSAYESLSIKQKTSDDFITLTPGIRPKGSDVGDQKRVMTPSLAKEQKVDYIVVGRPIYKSSNPQEVVANIIKEL